jgi:hypothetical protein
MRIRRKKRVRSRGEHLEESGFICLFLKIVIMIKEKTIDKKIEIFTG